jgi:hypothetical protein
MTMSVDFMVLRPTRFTIQSVQGGIIRMHLSSENFLHFPTDQLPDLATGFWKNALRAQAIHKRLTPTSHLTDLN